MCIAIVKTKDGIISDKTLRNCFKNNPDGAGMAYTNNGDLYVIKGIFNEDEFIKTYHEVEAIADNNMLIHCRISTSGLIDVDNSHPHVVNDSTVLIHNGVLDIDVPKDSKKSDTVLFIEKYLSELPIDFTYNKQILKLIEDRIGKTNKFAFLNSNGDYAILNEDKGEWVNKVWYSNSSYDDNYGVYTYASKYYDDYDYEDEMYRYQYGMTREQFLDCLLTNDKTVIRDTEALIKSLTDEELLALGSTPIIDVEKIELREDDGWADLNEFYLFELDGELQDLYDMRYYHYENVEDIDQYV